MIREDLHNISIDKLLKEDILNYLTATKKAILDEQYNRFIENFTFRTRSRLQSIGCEMFIRDYLFKNNRELLNIQGFGKNSLIEAISLKEKMKSELLQLMKLSEDKISIINLVNQKGEIILNDFVSNFHKENNHLPMFWILEQYLRNDNARYIKIFVDTFPVFHNKRPQTLKEVAKKYNLTRERVRQIRDEVNKTFKSTDNTTKYKNRSELFELFKYSKLLQNTGDWSYILELLPKISYTNQEPLEIQEYLKKEQCNFSVEFFLQIIANLFRDTFSFFSDFKKPKRERIWKNTFLIRKEYADTFDFVKMREEFENLLSDNEVEYLLDIENYIANSHCWLKSDFDKSNNIIRIVRNILLYEFNLYSREIDGKLTIPVTKKLNLRDTVYEILKTKGEPMHFDDIFVEFQKILPKHKYAQKNSPNNLRQYLYRNKDIALKKCSGIYVLREWGYIYSGTIRDAIIEFLSNNDLPQTLEDIGKHVLLYFPEANITNVNSSLHTDKKKRFVYFQDRLFGLANKEYPPFPEYIQIKRRSRCRKSFEKRLYDLEKFVAENDYFPLSFSGNKETESLSCWWSQVISGRIRLTENQRSEFEKVKQKYAEYEKKKSAYNWNLKYNKLKTFLLENGRVPSIKDDENSLNNWLRNVRSNFLDCRRLSEEQRKKYIELTKLI